MNGQVPAVRLASTLLVFSGVVLLIWAGLIRPAGEWRNDRFAARSKAIAELNRLQETVARLELEAAQYSQQDSLDLIWASGEVGEVTAKVQARISSIARASSVALRTIAPIKAPDLPLVQTIGFRIEGEARLDQLVDFLRAVESSSPSLVIGKAHLRRLNRLGDLSELPVVFLQIELAAPISTDEKAVQ